MRLINIKKQNKGFTLVEILISISIFGILMVAFLSLFTSAYYMTIRAGDRDKTVAGISGKVENKIASSAYNDPEIAQSSADVILTYGDGSTNTVPVDKTSGTSHMQDGTEVKIDYYKAAAVSP